VDICGSRAALLREYTALLRENMAVLREIAGSFDDVPMPLWTSVDEGRLF